MNTLQRSFNTSLKREGKIINVANTEVKVIFRKNDDGNNETDRVKILYSIDAPINQGDIFTYKDKYFLVINKETVENDIYFRSSVIATNCTLNDNNGSYNNIKCYCSGLTSSVTMGNEFIKLVAGNVELITTDNETSRKIAIGTTFNEFGGTYKVMNTYYQDSIAHIYAERGQEVTPVIEYTMSYTGSTEISMDDKTLQLYFKAYANGIEDATATFTYTSSDESMATVDTNGLLTLVKDGNVTITAIWTEHDISCDTTITISEGTPPTPIHLGYSDITSTYDYIKYGSSRTFTAHFYLDNGTEVSDVIPTWTLSNYSNDYVSDLGSYLTVTYPTNNTIKISVARNDDLFGETFDLTLSADGYTSSTKSIEISE